MSAVKYERIADDVSVDASQVDLAPTPLEVKPKSRRRLVLTLVTIFALLLVFFSLTTPRSDPAPYNPLPNKDDRSFNSTSLPVVLWHGMGDSCCATWSVGALQKQIQDALPGQIMLPLLLTNTGCQQHKSLLLLICSSADRCSNFVPSMLSCMQAHLCTALPLATTLGMTHWGVILAV